MPVSSTLPYIFTVLSLPSLLQPMRRVIVPSWVNFTALFKRFTIICLIRISSPISPRGISGSICNTKETLLSFSLMRIIAATSTKREANWKDEFINSILPASILEKSKISLIIVKREVDAFLMRMAFSLANISVVSRIMNSAMP